MTTSTSRPGPPAPRVLPLLWLVSTLCVATVGWLLFAVSDWSAERLAGGVLLALAPAGLVAAAGTRTVGAGPRRLSLAASALFLLGGVAGSLLVLTRATGAADVVLVLGVPTLCALVTGGVALRRGPLPS